MNKSFVLSYRYITTKEKESIRVICEPTGGKILRRFKQYTVIEYIDYLKTTDINRDINQIHLHHTWKPTKEDYYNASNKEDIILGMWSYHTVELGWSDIGQHISLAPDGRIWDGRDINETPASIKGHNTGAFAIEMIGNFDIGHEKLEGKQLEALIELLIALFEIFKGSKFLFHREYSKKTCPGTSINKEALLRMVKKNKYPSDISEWAKKGYDFITQSDLSDGSRPKTPVTREEMWVMIQRYHEKYGK